MTNTYLLEDLIKKSGLKKQYLAKGLGLTPESFSRKVQGKNEFKVSEMQVLCDLLGIDDWNLRERVFLNGRG